MYFFFRQNYTYLRLTLNIVLLKMAGDYLKNPNTVYESTVYESTVYESTVYDKFVYKKWVERKDIMQSK